MHRCLSYYAKGGHKQQTEYVRDPLSGFLSASGFAWTTHGHDSFYFCTSVFCCMRVVISDFLFVLVENHWYRHFVGGSRKLLVHCSEGEVSVFAVDSLSATNPPAGSKEKICSNQIAWSLKGFPRGKLIHGVVYTTLLLKNSAIIIYMFLMTLKLKLFQPSRILYSRMSLNPGDK